MPDREWMIHIGDFWISIRRRTEGGGVKSFAVVLFVIHEEAIMCVTRYDTAHGYPHRDVLGLTEGLRGKLRTSNLNYNEAFSYAIRDIKENAEIYLADFLAH